jgi:Glycosyl transferase family 2
MESLFWACVAFVFYGYLGYPMIMYVLARFFPKPVHRGDITPRVSLIITARNEEKRIGDKIENSLALDYPHEQLEVIVTSDCSTDDTHAIVARYADRGVRLVVAPERRGKEFAQKCAIRASAGEILVFSDVATRLDADGVRAIVANFADASVGCVSSVDRLVDADGTVSGEGAYVRYEMYLRSLESMVGSVVGLSGSFFAARRDVCDPWAEDLPSDFTTLLNTLQHGMRGISDVRAIGYYPNLANKQNEYGRKVRTVVRGMSGLGRHLHLLNPFRYGLAAWQLFSHKVCRWLVPFGLIGALAASLALLTRSPFYLAVGLLQVGAYAVAANGLRDPDRQAGIPRLLTFLVLVNVSILHAWYRVLRGRRVVAWEPSRR